MDPTSQEFDVLANLEHSEVFRLLPAEVLREVAVMARMERYHERTLLVPLGHVPEHIRYVISGSVDLTLSSADGRMASLPILPGQWATWLGCFSSSPVPHEIWSSKSAVFLAFPNHVVRKVVSSEPRAMLEVIEKICYTLRFLIAWTLSATAFSAEKRLAYLLLVASSGSAQTAPEAEAAITQTQLAQLGFGSRQRVGRLLLNLKKHNLIDMKYGCIIIPSRENLKAFID
jgi:CRP-like cAMP-binding protein